MPGIRLDPHSLRLRLTLLFGGLTLATLLVAGIYAGETSGALRRTSIGESLQAVAKGAADLLGQAIHQREVDIARLALSPQLVEGDLGGDSARALMRLRQDLLQGYAWIGIVAADGRVRQATGGILLGQDVSQRPWFQAAQRGPYLGDVHEALLLAQLLPRPTNGEPLRFIDVAAPIRGENGELRGVLGSHLHWDWAARIAQEALPPDAAQRGLQVLIVNGGGRVIYPAGMIGQTLAQDLSSRDRDDVPWADGRTYLSAQAPVRSAGQALLDWRVIVRQPADTALEPVIALRNRLLGAALGAVLLVVGLAYRFATRIAQPIEALADVARRLGSDTGGSSQASAFPPPTGLQEVDRLSQALQRMSNDQRSHALQLQALNVSLEKQVADRTGELRAANEALQRLATEDALTGLANRRRLDEVLGREFEAFRRFGRSYAVLMIDVDGFKGINDTHGHAVGDRVLRQLATLLSGRARGTDMVARFGGEEFLVLLPETRDVATARWVAEELRGLIEAATFPTVGRVTVSIGLSLVEVGDVRVSDAVQRADAALYQAKQAGRNRVATGFP